jgi:signal transduction histidine kinase/integral membrane sensor domain MASE1/Fe-S cluster biosynthesis and repair protein YggX
MHRKLSSSSVIQRIKIYFSQSLFHKLLLNLLIAGIYFLVGWASLELATINRNVSPYWLPSGIAVTAILLFGRLCAPGILLGAIAANMVTTAPTVTSILIGFGNTSEGLIGATIIRWFIEKSGLGRYSEIFGITLAALLSSILSASIGASALVYGEVIPLQDFNYNWYTWWSGDTVGMLILLPLSLELVYPEKRRKKINGFFFILAVLVLGVVSIVFYKNLNQAYAWGLCPLFILMGFLYPSYLARLVLLVSSLIVVLMISYGFGPFEYGNLNLNYIYVQSLLSSFAISVLFARPFDTEFKVRKLFVFGNILGWVSLFVVIFQITKTERDHLFDDIHHSTELIISSLQKENLQYERLMDSGEALLQIKPDPTPQDWKTFSESVDFKSQFPGINGYGIFQKIKKSEFKKFQAQKLERGINVQRVRTLDPEFAREFEDQYIIYMIEPLEKNSSGIGIDVGSESKRREALEESKRVGKTVATDSIELVINEGFIPGFLILHPVPSRNDIHTWIYAPVVTKNYYDEVLKPSSHLFDSRVFNRGMLIYEIRKNNLEKWQNDAYLVKRKVLIFNREFEFEFYPTAEFFNRHSGSASAMAFLLNLFMLFILGFLLEQITFGLRTEELVIQRTKELEESKIQLLQASKMASLGEMASGMAHEINNPLTIITAKLKVLSFMLADLKTERPEIFGEMDRIQITTDRISKIVKGLKSFSRSSVKDPFELVSLKDIVNETLALCAEKFKSEGIDLEVSEVPNIFLHCRSGQISQVLLNLLNNSRDAVEDLKNKWIKIDFEVKGLKLIDIMVTDSGEGIPKEVSERMMEPFFTTKVVGKGTGLGLSIAKGIIDDHGGKLYLNSRSFHTRFVIEIPY